MIYKKFTTLESDYQQYVQVSFENIEFYNTFINCYYKSSDTIHIFCTNKYLMLRGQGKDVKTLVLNCTFDDFIEVMLWELDIKKYEVLLHHLCCYKLMELNQPINIHHMLTLIKKMKTLKR